MTRTGDDKPAGPGRKAQGAANGYSNKQGGTPGDTALLFIVPESNRPVYMIRLANPTTGRSRVRTRVRRNGLSRI